MLRLACRIFDAKSGRSRSAGPTRDLDGRGRWLRCEVVHGDPTRKEIPVERIAFSRRRETPHGIKHVLFFSLRKKNSDCRRSEREDSGTCVTTTQWQPAAPRQQDVFQQANCRRYSCTAMMLEKLAPEKVADRNMDCRGLRVGLCNMLRMVPESIGHLDYHELLTQR